MMTFFIGASFLLAIFFVAILMVLPSTLLFFGVKGDTVWRVERRLQMIAVTSFVLFTLMLRVGSTVLR